MLFLKGLSSKAFVRGGTTTRSVARHLHQTSFRRPAQSRFLSSSRAFSTIYSGGMIGDESKSGVSPAKQESLVTLTSPFSSTTTSTSVRCFGSEARNMHRRQREHGSPKQKGSGITVVGKRSSGKGYCYGCGADLVTGEVRGQMQTVDKQKGFWAQQKDELHKAKLKNWMLCPRCRALSKKTNVSEEVLEALGPDSKMTQVFREEVSKIRTKEKAVVVYCVDAVNISGSIIKTIRNYVGGNPILLAVTRCDLLPPYVWKRHPKMDSLKKVFRHQAADITPAAVYLCSEDNDYRDKVGGINELTDDLWKHLNGRDPYVIGSANIGKSTLTDILIAKFASRGMKAGHFGDKMSKRRLEKLRESRITKSSLPGTTLQNVRVPCFEDHNQALWDTPGLLLDESLRQFPIRNLRTIRAQRPSQIEPHIHETDKKGFCLIISEVGDDALPLIRIEVRLKKDASGEGPVRLVWNSTLNLETKIVDIPEAYEDEQRRWQVLEDEDNKRKEESRQKEQELANLTTEERRQRKEERTREIKERIEKEKVELGMKEFNRREKQKQQEIEDRKRIRTLAKLTPVHQVVLERNVGTDITIANFGWIGLLVPRTTLVKAYAPSSGVRVNHTPTLGLPTEWGEYARDAPSTGRDAEKRADKDRIPVGKDEEDDSDIDSDFDEDDEDYGLDDDDFDEDEDEDWDDEGMDRFGMGHGDSYDDYDDFDMYDDTSLQPDRFGFVRDGQEEENDVWAQYSGKHVGWQYDADTRFMKIERTEGWNPLRENEQSQNEKVERESA